MVASLKSRIDPDYPEDEPKLALGRSILKPRPEPMRRHGIVTDFAGLLPELVVGGEIEPMGWRRLLDGYHPTTGVMLRQNAGGDCDRHGRGLPVNGFDLTLSAPKTVSVLMAGLLSRPEFQRHLAEAQTRATDAAFRVLRRFLWSRRGSGGKRRVPADTIFVSYRHFEARPTQEPWTIGDFGILSSAGQPNLHDHNLIPNIGLGADGRWGTLDATLIFDAKMALGAVYRAELAYWLQERLSVVIHSRADGTFDVAGFPPAVIQHFSRRRAEVIGAAAYDTAKARSVAVLKTRRSKIDTDGSHFHIWKSELERLRFDPISVIGRAAPPSEADRLAGANRAVASGIENLFSGPSPGASEAAIWREAAARATGVANVEMISRIIDAQIDGGRLVPGQNRRGRAVFVRSKELAHEQRLEGLLLAAREVRRKPLYPRGFVRLHVLHAFGDDLWPDEVDALAALLKHDQSICLHHPEVQGGEGGRALQEYCRVAAALGYRVIVVSPKGASAGALAGSLPGAAEFTVGGLVTELEAGRELVAGRTIVIAPSAWALPSSDLRRLLELLDLDRGEGASIVLAGTRIDRGLDASPSRTMVLVERVIGPALDFDARVGRLTARERRAARSALTGRESGIAELHADGKLVLVGAGEHVELGEQETFDAVAQAWGEAVEQRRDAYSSWRTEGQVSIIVGSRAEVEGATRSVREQARRMGLLRGPDVSILVSSPGLRTDRPILREMNVAVGDRILVFGGGKTRNISGAVRADLVSIEDDNRILRMNWIAGYDLDGRPEVEEIVLDTFEHPSLQHAYVDTPATARGMHVAVALGVVAKGAKHTSRDLAEIVWSIARESATVFINRPALVADLKASSPPVSRTHRGSIQDDNALLGHLAQRWSRSSERLLAGDFIPRDRRTPIMKAAKLLDMHAAEERRRFDSLRKRGLAVDASRLPKVGTHLGRLWDQLESLWLRLKELVSSMSVAPKPHGHGHEQASAADVAEVIPRAETTRRSSEAEQVDKVDENEAPRSPKPRQPSGPSMG